MADHMKKRLMWVDIAKGIAIALVVLGHCLESLTPLRVFIYSFHMPLFFILAGFTMRAKPRKDVLLSSLRRLMLPYLAVSAILLFFAFYPPSSFSSTLDPQMPPMTVVAEIFYGSGQPVTIFGQSFEAIGAIWFLPCLFFARLMLNEVLLRCEKAAVWVEPVVVAAIAALGFLIGKNWHLPFVMDIAMIAVGFMYVGYLVKKLDLSKVPWLAIIPLAAVWMLYPYAGNNEMAVHAYIDHPFSLLTAIAGSIVVMKCCTLIEKIPLLDKGLAWCGVSSLLILCVHRVESAIFNWQTIMQTFRPDVWDWNSTAQGLYQFGLRFTLVVAMTIAIQRSVAFGRYLFRVRQRFSSSPSV